MCSRTTKGGRRGRIMRGKVRKKVLRAVKGDAAKGGVWGIFEKWYKGGKERGG